MAITGHEQTIEVHNSLKLSSEGTRRRIEQRHLFLNTTMSQRVSSDQPVGGAMMWDFVDRCFDAIDLLESVRERQLVELEPRGKLSKSETL